MLSFDMARMMHDDQLLDVARRYGDICALRAFGEDFILLNSYDVIREAAILKPMDFVNRRFGNQFSMRQLDPNREALITNDFSPKTRAFRSASLSIFRDLGVGRSKMEECMTEEVNALVDRLQSRDGTAFDSRSDVRLAITAHCAPSEKTSSYSTTMTSSAKPPS